MKFYLTKAAQRAAEGGGSKSAAPASRAATPEKRVRAAKKPQASAAPAIPRADSAASVETPVAAPSAAAGMVAAEPVLLPVKQPKPVKGVIPIGGLPRVDLLPPEVRAERRAAVNVRRAWTAVAGLVVIVGAAGGTSALYAQSAQSTLTASQKQTATLSTETAKYSEVKTTEGQVDLIDAARTVGGSTDIDWPAYLAKVQATLPDGMTLATVTIDSASPVVEYAQATTPLEGQRVATLSFSATSSSLPSVPAWLTRLATLPGYTDASAGTVALSSGVYTAGVVVHIDADAFSNTYTKEGK